MTLRVGRGSALSAVGARTLCPLCARPCRTPAGMPVSTRHRGISLPAGLPSPIRVIRAVCGLRHGTASPWLAKGLSAGQRGNGVRMVFFLFRRLVLSLLIPYLWRRWRGRSATEARC